MTTIEAYDGDRLKTLFVTCTEACNSRCGTCDYWRIGRPAQLRTDQMEAQIVEGYANGLTSVYFTGGEPLLRADDLFALADRLRERCPDLNLYLLTNGLMLKKYTASVLGRFSRVIISLDAASSDLYYEIRGVHSFNVVLEAIRHMRRAAPEVSIRLRTVVMAENVDSLIDIALLARDLEVDRLSFLAEDSTSRAFGVNDVDQRRRAHESGALLADRVDREIERLDALLAGDAPVPVLPDLADLRRVSDLYRYGAAPVPCNAGALSSVIDADSSVLPCFFIPTDFSLEDASLSEIRRSEGWRRLVDEIQTGRRQECASCVCPRLDVDEHEPDAKQPVQEQD